MYICIIALCGWIKLIALKKYHDANNEHLDAAIIQTLRIKT